MCVLFQCIFSALCFKCHPIFGGIVLCLWTISEETTAKINWWQQDVSHPCWAALATPNRPMIPNLQKNPAINSKARSITYSHYFHWLKCFFFCLLLLHLLAPACGLFDTVLDQGKAHFPGQKVTGSPSSRRCCLCGCNGVVAASVDHYAITFNVVYILLSFLFWIDWSYCCSSPRYHFWKK